MSAPKPWWDELQSKKPGPSRIRVSFSRSFTEAEREFLRQLGNLAQDFVGDKLRVSPDDRVYVESSSSTSRDMYEAVSAVVASHFVNVFPVAVRTFRELVLPPAKPHIAVTTDTFTTTNTTNYADPVGTLVDTVRKAVRKVTHGN